jgi:hypothetical protein
MIINDADLIFLIKSDYLMLNSVVNIIIFQKFIEMYQNEFIEMNL